MGNIIAGNIWYLEERIVRLGNHKGQSERGINTLITTIGKFALGSTDFNLQQVNPCSKAVSM